MVSATLNSPVLLSILAADGNTALFARIKVYDFTGGLVSTFTAGHVANGLYQGTWTPITEGFYTYVAQLFTDILFTIDAGYDRVGELIDVNTIKSQLVRILGLHNENTVIDSQTYDSQQKLLTARIRTYDSKANALAAGAVGLIAEYSVSAQYTLDLLSNFKVVRDI